MTETAPDNFFEHLNMKRTICLSFAQLSHILDEPYLHLIIDKLQQDVPSRTFHILAFSIFIRDMRILK